MSIKRVLIITIVGLLLVTVGVIQLSTYLSTRDVLLGHAPEMMESVAQDTISRSKEFLAPAQDAGRSLPTQAAIP